MAIDQATRAVLSAMAAQGLKPLHESTPQEIRAGSARSATAAAPRAMHAVEDLRVPGPGGDLALRLLVPSATPRATVLYFHGGGWVLGDIDGFEPLGRALALAADVTVVMVDYRLAPESPYPAAVEDAWAALTWAEQAVGTAPGLSGPILLAGDSAGANLAIVAALRARGTGPEVAGMLLMYPVTDCDLDRPSYLDPANQLLISRDSMAWFFDHYVGAGDRTHTEVSPLRAPDLTGLPPTALGLAEHDPLRDEGEAFGKRLRDSGVAVEQHVFEGQMHGFLQMIDILPGSARAVDWFARVLAERMLPERTDNP